MSTIFNPSAFRSEVAARGLTMRELARMSGVHEVSLYNYCRGYSSPSPRSLSKIAFTLARVPRLPVDLSGEGDRTANIRPVAANGGHGSGAST